MSGIRNWSRGVVVFGLLLLLASLASGQAPDSTPDPCPIVSEFVQAALAQNSTAGFLSPAVGAAEREKQIALTQKKFLSLEIYNYDCVHGLQLRSPDHADLKADVHWATAHSDFRQSVTLHLVRVDGKWYFEDFDFFVFNWKLALTGGVLAIVWAGFVLASISDWRKRRFRTRTASAAWIIAVFVPLLGVAAYWIFVRRSPIVQTTT